MFKKSSLLIGILAAGLISVGCAGETETIVVEKEVLVEVPVEKVVEKQVVVEKEVVKEVPVEKIVEVEKVEIKEVVKEVIVEKEVEKSAASFLDGDTVYNFTMAGQLSPTLKQWTDLEAPWLLGDDSKVVKNSNGKVKVKLNTASELGVGQFDVLRFLSSGVIDIGMAVFTSISGDVPIAGGIDLAGAYPELDGVKAKAGTEAFIPELNKQMEDKMGIKIIGHYNNPAQVPYCKFPITGSADLKDKRVRTFGSTLGDYVEHFGGINVTIAFVDVYSAMQTGIADCAITGTGSGNAQKWYEITEYLYTLPVGHAITGWGANLDMWNKQPTDVQDFLQDTFTSMTADGWDLGMALTQDGIDCNTGVAAGCTLGTLDSDSPMTQVVPSEADYDSLKAAASETVLPRWVERCGVDCKVIYNRTIAEVTGVSIP